MYDEFYLNDDNIDDNSNSIILNRDSQKIKNTDYSSPSKILNTAPTQYN